MDFFLVGPSYATHQTDEGALGAKKKKKKLTGRQAQAH